MTDDRSILRTWAEIDMEAIRHNLRAVASFIGSESDIMMVVKANAYGHGIESVCLALENENIAFWGVANISEARVLRDIGTEKRIFILGPTFPEERPEIVEHGWTTFISTKEEAEHFDRLAEELGENYTAHIGVDTGMGREGFLPEDLLSYYRELLSFPHLRFEGIGSHMPSADEDNAFTQRQIDEFVRISSGLEKEHPLRYKHLANSAGVSAWNIPGGNLVRPGLILYGHDPVNKNPSLDLKRTIRLKSRITMVNTLPAGHGVSYGRDYITQAPTKVATIGIGYADGYPRQVSNKGAEVCIRGKKCPLLGRVTMDQIIVDVTHLPEACPGDEVELFGDTIRVEDLAKQADTIIWDIFTGVGKRVNRVS